MGKKETIKKTCINESYLYDAKKENRESNTDTSIDSILLQVERYLQWLLYKIPPRLLDQTPGAFPRTRTHNKHPHVQDILKYKWMNPILPSLH